MEFINDISRLSSGVISNAIPDDILDFLNESITSDKKLNNIKRNLSVSFADGTVCAEIIHNYYPKIITLNNYPETSSVIGRTNNWEVLNKKVLKKINCELPSPLISVFVNRESTELIHQFLRSLKMKLAAYEPMYSSMKVATNNSTTNERLYNESKKKRDVQLKNKLESTNTTTNVHRINREAYLAKSQSNGPHNKIIPKATTKILQR